MNEVMKLEQVRSRRGGKLAFFLGFVRRPDLVGSVIPSSRFLTRRLVEIGAVANARLVVEFGPGTGGTTQAILDALPQDARLLSIEINPEFVALLNSNPDPRLIVHPGCAGRVRDTLALYGLGQPDAIISGIPFSTMPLALGQQILQAVWSSLRPGGHFVAYQFTGRVAELARELLGKPEVAVELLNLPPVRVFDWRKPGVEPATGV